MDKKVTVEQIQKAACKHFHVTLGDMKSKKRSSNIALPRQLAMYLCRRHTTAPYSLIGFKFGGREHSTVVHALKSIEKKIRQDSGILMSLVRLEEDVQRESASDSNH